MSFHFTFRTLDSTKDLKQLVDFLIKQDLGYKKYEDWVQHTESEIDIGYKTAILAFSDSQLVGDLIYQTHKELYRVRELKNMRIHPEFRRRDFAHFMLRQAESENPEEYDAIICDLRADQTPTVNLLLFSGYISIATVNLYDTEKKDVVMIKTLDQRTESGIIYNTKNVICNKAKLA